MTTTEKEFFNTLAIRGVYDVFPEEVYEKIFLRIKRLQPGSMILDVGTGSGAWGIRIAKRETLS